MTPGFETAAWSWVDHLRHGGSTPWLRWSAPEAAAPPDSATLPGAAELEFVRRLADRAPASLAPPEFTAVADRALARSGPGRGLAQLPLVWPGDPAGCRVGAPPIDPAAVPAGELVRVGVGTLVDLLLDLPPGPDGGRAPRRRPWSRPFRLAGAPVTADAVRDSLRAAGHVEGGRRPDVLVFVEPFDVHLAQIWSGRVQRGAPVRWQPFVGRWARRRELPPAARLPAIAAHWAARVGPERVHLVVAPRDTAAARRTASEVLGLRGGDGTGRTALHDLSPAGTDLLSRVNRVLGVRVEADRRRVLLRRAAGLVAGHGGTPVAVPPAHRDWATGTAARLAEELRAGGYAVHGDLAGVAVRHATGPTRPRHGDVLDLVLGACLALAEKRRLREAR